MLPEDQKLRRMFLQEWRARHAASRCQREGPRAALSSRCNEYRMSAYTALAKARHVTEGISPPIVVDNPCYLEYLETPPSGALCMYREEEAKSFYWWLRTVWSKDHFGEPV